MTRVINMLAVIVLVAVAFGLYRAKTEARGDRARVAALELQLAEAHENVLILRNEIAHLERPERLRELARDHLGLAPVDPLRVVTLEDAPLLIETPTLDEHPQATDATYRRDH